MFVLLFFFCRAAKERRKGLLIYMAPPRPSLSLPSLVGGQRRVMLAALAATVVMLVLWFWTLRRSSALPLRRAVDPKSVTGVTKRYRTLDPVHGRRLLRRMGNRPAILIPYASAWHVWTGPELTVVPVADDTPGSVVVEFTYESQPRMVARAPTTAPIAPAAPPTTAPTPTPDERLVELQGPLNVLSFDPSRIRRFFTLQEATAAAGVGPSPDGLVDHIVGGSSLHPVYYVVPATPAANQSSNSQRANNDEDDPTTKQRVWIRGPINTTGQHTDKQ